MDELPDLGGRDERDQPGTNAYNGHVEGQDDGFDDNDDGGYAENDDGYAEGYQDDDGTAYAEDDSGEYAEYDDADDDEYASDQYEGDEYEGDDYTAYDETAEDDPDDPGDPGDDGYDGYDDADETDDEPVPGELVGPVITAGLVDPRDPAEPVLGRRGRRIGALPAFIAGTLVGLLVLGLVWASVGLTGSGTSEAADTRPAASTQHPAKARSARPDPLQQCRTEAAAQTKALDAARSSLDQWEVHVGAMNRWVVGAITLQQANQFWNQTRHGAADRLTAFLAADTALHRLTAHCPTAPDSASAALRSCRDAVAARGRALRAAEVAANTWRHHVRDMEMLRTGRMSGAMANQMWLANWHKGVDQLHAYRSAVARIPADGC